MAVGRWSQRRRLFSSCSRRSVLYQYLLHQAIVTAVTRALSAGYGNAACHPRRCLVGAHIRPLHVRSDRQLGVPRARVAVDVAQFCAPERPLSEHLVQVGQAQHLLLQQRLRVRVARSERLASLGQAPAPRRATRTSASFSTTSRLV